MDSLLIVPVIIFMVLNLILYHAIFDVFYFDLGKGCFTEIFWSFVVACMETALIMKIGAVALRIIIIIAIVIGIIVAIKKIAGAIQNRSSKDDEVADELVNDTTSSSQEKVINESKAITIETDKTELEKTGHEKIAPEKAKAEDAEAENIKSEKSSLETSELEKKIFCQYCGKKIKASTKFCNFCGKENKYRRREVNDM